LYEEKMLSRRGFLLSTASIIVLAAAGPADAIWKDPTPEINSNTVVNFGAGFYTLFNGAYLNLAKWFQPGSSEVGWLGKLSGINGYPNGSFSSMLNSLMLFDPAYYGRYILSWSGAGGVGGISGNPTIVYNGASASGVNVFGVSPSGRGVTRGNMAIAATSGADIEFAFGLLIGAVTVSGSGDHGGAGLVKFTTADSGYAGNLVDGQTFKFNNGISGLPATGPNSDGSWSIWKINNNNFSLQGSSAYAGLVTITARGGPGAQTEGIYCDNSNVALFGTFTGFSDLILCAKSDLADIQAGKLAKQGIISALAATKASYIRFMDMVSVQNNQGIASFSDRITPKSFTWGPVTCPMPYWAGQLTNTSDAFTCSNPSDSPPSGAYADSEVVVAQVGASGQNTTQHPTLALTGRSGAVPIYNALGSLLNLTLAGSVPASGTAISIVFTGGGLASAFTYHYVTSTSAAGPGTVLDTSLNNIAINIRADIQGNVRGNAGPLVAAHITSVNGSFTDGSSQMSFYYNPNINSSGAAQLGAGFTISASDSGGATTYTAGLMQAGYLANSNYVAFTYNALLGGWIATPYGTNGNSVQIGGVRGGPPLEFYEEVCTRANAGMWYNFGITSPSSVIYDTVFHIAQSSVKGLVCEFSNETWNSAASQWGLCQSLAAGLGLSTGGQDSFTGLRIIQMAQQATAAWAAAGRPRSQLKIACAYWFIDLSTRRITSTKRYRFEGAELNASSAGTNVTLKAYGGPANGTSSPTALTTNYSVAPNRPIDWSDWAAPAPYWGGGQYNSGNGSSSINTGVPLSAYNGSLLAAYNFAFGTSAQQQAALDFLYSISVGNGDLYNGTLNRGSPDADVSIVSWSMGSGLGGDSYFGVGTVAASYDTSRLSRGTGGGAQTKVGVACYEGGWIMGPIAGTGDPSVVASDLARLGYGTGYSSSLPGATTRPSAPRGISDTATLAGTNLANLLLAWKNDARCLSLVSRQFQQFKAAVNIVSTRDAYPCWYGFQGAGDWALYPGLASQSGPFQPVAALAAYN
jgi:hypothetical protein